MKQRISPALNARINRFMDRKLARPDGHEKTNGHPFRHALKQSDPAMEYIAV